MFGPASTLGSMLCKALSLTNVIQLNGHWMAPDRVIAAMQNNIICLRWVTPQVIIPWLGICLVLLEKDRITNWGCFCAPMLITSIFTSLGAIPLLLAGLVDAIFSQRKEAAQKKKARAAKVPTKGKIIAQICSPQNLVILITFVPIVYLYYLGNINNGKPESIGFQAINYSGMWAVYFIFILSHVLIYVLPVLKFHYRSAILYASTFTLLVLPLFSYGKCNDLCMRASIPALFVLMVLVLEYLLNQKKKIFKKAIIAVGMLFSFSTLFFDYNIASFSSQQSAISSNSTLAPYMTSSDPQLKYNYFSFEYEDSLFYTYFARRNNN